MKVSIIILCLSFIIFIENYGAGQISQIWLTHSTNNPSHIVINWKSNHPGNSEVWYRIGNSKEYHIIIQEEVTLHHVSIPIKKKDLNYDYRVATGDEKSNTHSFKGYPSNPNELRIALVGNWGYADNPDLSQLVKDNPHLLLTLGDNVPNLYEACGEGVKDCTEPFLRLIDSAPSLFQTTPFMPILGNHDKQIRERGKKYPSQAVYDIDAKAYRRFFKLPDDEWKWHFRIPDFNVCFIALDLNHISDFGTTWQTCHDFQKGSTQREWYHNLMEKSEKDIVITLQNEKAQTIRELDHGSWASGYREGTIVLSGYGYYSEYAEEKGVHYFNSSLKAGDLYPDKSSKMICGEGGYMLLLIRNHDLEVRMKSLDGEIMGCYLLSVNRGLKNP